MKSLYNPLSLDIFSPGLVYRALTKARIGQVLRSAQSYIKQEHNIWRQNLEGVIRPTVLHIELTTYCGSPGCRDCYLTPEERQDKTFIDYNTAQKAIDISNKWGINAIDLIGGQTFSNKTTPVIRELIMNNNRSSFYCCTDGAYINAKKGQLDDIMTRDNFSVGLSIDGLEQMNDFIRGKGMFKKVTGAAEYLRSRRCLFGSVVSLRPENYMDVTSELFIDYLIEKGFLFLSYSVSDNISIDNFMEASRNIKQLKRKPIKIYSGLVGNDDSTLTGNKSSNITRDIYVSKNGIFFPGRRVRTPIGDINSDPEEMVRHPKWIKRFSEPRLNNKD